MTQYREINTAFLVILFLWSSVNSLRAVLQYFTSLFIRLCTIQSLSSTGVIQTSDKAELCCVKMFRCVFT